MPRVFLVLPLALILGCTGAGGSKPTADRDPPPPDLDFPVGAFALVDQDGKPFTEKDLLGKVWVASFVFTRCTGPCPSVSRTMTQLQKELPDDPDNLKLVTFTVDPGHDRPEDLKAYAKSRQADPRRWVFLTGDEKAIHDLMQTRFKLAVGRKPGPDVKPGDEFDHSTRLAVVDRKGVIRGTFDGIANETHPNATERFEESRKRLREKVSQLLAEK